MSEKIRILIADDHAIVREGMYHLIGGRPDMDIIGEAEDGAQAVQLAGELVTPVTQFGQPFEAARFADLRQTFGETAASLGEHQLQRREIVIPVAETAAYVEQLLVAPDFALESGRGEQ